ncbi:hypothetical protein Tco_0089319 [Tanacetum coccineum]
MGSECLLERDLSAYWRGISSEEDFLGTAPSYTTIRDPMLRMCHSPETREADAAAGAPKVAKGAPDIDEGVQAIPVPIQAPQPPPAAGPARTLPQKVARLIPEIGLHGFIIFCTGPRWKEIDNVGKVSLSSGILCVVVMLEFSAFTTHILAH